ncbi:MAG: hypothetical protein HGA96_07845 [Desulfobulbaceae bacterium]|nr:hypothetical protein [Desulfobulbaceae bacterium]
MDNSTPRAGDRWWTLRAALVVGAVLLLSGCAYRPLLRPLVAGEAAVGRQAFRQLVGGQGICARAVDAEVTVTLDVPWQSGTIAGYLQLLAPGYLKFIGVNPLGQPLLVLGSDGVACRYVLPAERKMYEGRLAEATVSRYLPPGLDLTRSYYWLIGRLRPGQVDIREVAGEPGGAGLWVQFRYAGEEQSELVLFDPRRLCLLRHLLLDKDGRTVLEVSYDSYAAGDCPLPGQVIIQGDNRLGRLVLRLGNWLPADTMTAADFVVTAPSDFVRIKIK